MKQRLHGLMGTLEPLARAGAVLLGVSVALGVLAGDVDAQQQFAPIDHVLLSLRAQSRGWMNHMLGPARSLAMGLGLIQFSWSMIKMGLSPNMGLQSALEAMFKQLMFVGFALVLIQFAPTWMPAIVESVQELGRGATGRAVPLSPQRVMQVAVELFVLVYQDLSAINPLEMLPIAGCLIILFLLYMLLACMMALAIAQVYLVMGAGVFLLGFQGSTWTQDLARGYLRYLLAAGVKLMVVTLIVSVGEAQVTVWLGLAQGDNGIGGSVELLLVAICSVAIIAAMVLTLPEYAAAMITGSTGFAGDGLVMAGAMGAASAAVAAGTVGGAAAAGALSGGDNAASGVAKAADTGTRGGAAPPPASGSSSGPVVSGGAGFPDLEAEEEGAAEGFLGPLDVDDDVVGAQGSTAVESSQPDDSDSNGLAGGTEDPESASMSTQGIATAAGGAATPSAAGDRSSANAAGHSGSGRMKSPGAAGGARSLVGRAAVAGAAAHAGGEAIDGEEDDDE